MISVQEFVVRVSVDRAAVERCLFEAAVACGLVAADGERAAWATLRSGLRAGIREPRQTPSS